MQSLQQIITDLQDMAAAEAEALAEPSNSLGSTIMRSSTRVLRSDSDLQRSKPPITVTPFWGPGLSTAAKPIVTSATSNPPVNSVEAFKAASWRPRSYSRDGNLSTSRDASRDSSRHGANNFWQFSSSLTSELLRSMFYKRLCWLLGARPAEHSLIAKAVQASSTGGCLCSISHTPLGLNIATGFFRVPAVFSAMALFQL